MSIAIDSKFPPLTFTDNSLVDAINFIKDGNILALHTTKTYRIFHSISFEKSEISEFLKNVRVIYLNCSHEGLLDEGEWDWYFKQKIKNVKELGDGDKLREVIMNQNLVPNKEFVTM